MTQQSSRAKTYSISGATPTWFPSPKTLTGTLTSRDITVTGTSTLFKDEINAGDYLVDVNNIARKVNSVESNTELILDEPFSADLASATCKAVQNQKFRSLKVLFITDNGTMKCASQDTPAAWPAGTVWEVLSEEGYQEPQLVTPGSGGASVIESI